MLRTRLIPILLLHNESLVKTVRFGKFSYVGDPCNTVRIFNELEVDELLFLDIAATRKGRPPNIDILTDIANECFMPLTYGGSIQSMEDAVAILNTGFEKVAINSYAVKNPQFIKQLSNHIGSQAVIVSIDVKKTFWGADSVRTVAGRNNSGYDPVQWAKESEALGAGEILLTSIDREGTWEGLDLDLIKRVTDAVDIPVIAHGGAGSVDDIEKVIKQTGASAVGLGSMVVFQKRGMGVLVNFPGKQQLEGIL